MTEELLFWLLAVSLCGIVALGHWIDRLRNEVARRDGRINELMLQLRETDGERATRLRKQLDESDDELEAVQDLNRLYEKHFGKPLL
jgi:hypothetical protein